MRNIAGRRKSFRRPQGSCAAIATPAKCVLVLGALAVAGCGTGEAIVDGFYGGIADTIAAVVSETLLSIAGF